MDELSETLANLGVTGVDLHSIKIIDRSEPVAEDNRQVYQSANNTLLTLIEQGDPGECIHVTGEMRALSDHLHRSVCRQILERRGDRVNMIGYVPAVVRNRKREDSEYWKEMGRETLRWMRENWPDATWLDCVDALDLVADAEVNLYSLPRQEEMHYSIFGDRYVLLQAKHPHGQHTKSVWFIESKPVYSRLTTRAHKTLERARYIPASIFSELTLSLSSPSALHVLFYLVEKSISKEEQSRQLEDLDVSRNVFLDLEAAGFVSEVEDFLQITSEGENYLSLFA